MIKALVLDDEPFSAKYLEELIKKNCPEIEEVISIFHVDEALQYLKVNRVQFLFLDIEMPMMNGIEFLEKCSLGSSTAIIMVTAYDNFALEAYKGNAVDYLVKPVELPQLLKAIQKGAKLVSQTPSKSIAKKISVYIENEFQVIELEDLLYLKAEGSYTNMVLKSKKFLISKRLGVIKEELPSSIFFRTHRSFVVNLNSIKQVGKSKEHYIRLSNGEVLPLSENKHQELLDKLKHM